MLGIVGGTGFAEFLGLQNIAGETRSTDYGDTYLERGVIGDTPVVFLPRHGHPPQFPPHRINYLANIQALVELEVSGIITVNAVGSVDSTLPVPSLVIPDQIIDYTWGREHTFHSDHIHHIDFTYPYDAELRSTLINAAGDLPCRASGVYGCTQGPRLESAAEIVRLARDGCHIVGMTAMPEAALAAERQVPYAGICLVVNAGAGINDQAVEMADIQRTIDQGMVWVRDILTTVISDRQA
jgi:5'-methylthioinosine phosphorylase